MEKKDARRKYWPLVMSPDLLVSYAAVYCNCKAADFEVGEQTAIKYAHSLIDNLDAREYSYNENGWEIVYEKGEEDCSKTDESFWIILNAEYEKNRVKYSLTFDISSFVADNIHFLNHGIQGSALMLLETYDASFREEFTLNYKNFATEIEREDERYELWIKRIQKATSTGAMVWEQDDWYFDSYFGEYKVSISRGRDLINGHLGSGKDADFIYVLYSNDNNDKSYFIRGDFKNLIGEIEKSIKKKQFVGRVRNTKAIDYREISTNNVLVLFHSFVCPNLKHNVEMVIGVIKMYSPKKGKFEEQVYLGYCNSCKRYMMLYSEYRRLKGLGTPLCTIVENNIYIDDNKTDFSSCREESLLFSFGYSATKSEEERREKLDMIIFSEIMSAFEVKNFLHWLETIHSKDKKFKKIVEIWENDINYIDKKYTNRKKKTAVDKLTVNKRIKDKKAKDTEK